MKPFALLAIVQSVTVSAGTPPSSCGCPTSSYEMPECSNKPEGCTNGERGQCKYYEGGHFGCTDTNKDDYNQCTVQKCDEAQQCGAGFFLASEEDYYAGMRKKLNEMSGFCPFSPWDHQCACYEAELERYEAELERRCPKVTTTTEGPATCPPQVTAGPGTSVEDGKCVVNLGSAVAIVEDKCEITCDSTAGRRLAEALEGADAPGPHTEPAGREHVKALLKDHPELVDALLRAGGEDGTVADDVLDKLIQFNQLFGQPALA